MHRLNLMRAASCNMSLLENQHLYFNLRFLDVLLRLLNDEIDWLIVDKKYVFVDELA